MSGCAPQIEATALRWSGLRWLLATVVVGVLGCGVVGCERAVLTEGDCMRVRDRIREAWRRDAVAALRDANTDAFRRYIQDESRRMGDRFMVQCSERVGLTVDADELACMNKVDSIDEVYACAGR